MAAIDIPPNRSIFLVNVSSAAKTFRLPAVSSFPGRMIIFKDIFGAAGNSSIFLSTTGADIIERSTATTTRLSTTYGAWTYLNDGARTWFLADMYANTMLVSTIFTGSSFTPTSITGGIMWLDATLLSGANGATITTWTSASYLYSLNMTGNGILSTNVLNGKQVISVNTGQTYTISNTGYTSASFTFFFVSRQTGGTNGRVFFGNGNTLYAYWMGYKNQLYMEGWIAGPYGTGSDTNWDIYTITRNSSGAGVFSRFGTTIVSYGSSGQGMTGFYINTGGSYPNEKSDAQIAEVIIYNVSHADADCRKIEGYLAWKWGLQASLPVGHTYKSAAP
jgi:hypothetical protein